MNSYQKGLHLNLMCRISCDIQGTKIGAIKTAEIYKKAISIYGDKVPTDRNEREDILTPDDEKEEERIEEILKECDDAFFEYEDDLVELNYRFIINNKESFIN